MKFLLALDASNFSKEQLQFPAYIVRLAKADLTALFLENMVPHTVPLGKYSSLEGFSNPYQQESDEIKQGIENNITAYTKACLELQLGSSIQRAAGIPETETIEASRFADLLLLSDKMAFGNGQEEGPTDFAEDVLTKAQCPVLVLPETMQEIGEVFFTGNGSASSMYAIRQFTSLFPGFRDKKTTVLFVTENEEEAAKYKRNIMEYLQHHYSDAAIETLSGNPADAILTRLSGQKNAIVTFGAYGRSKISQFFKKSKARNILNKLDLPVFITAP